MVIQLANVCHPYCLTEQILQKRQLINVPWCKYQNLSQVVCLHATIVYPVYLSKTSTSAKLSILLMFLCLCFKISNACCVFIVFANNLWSIWHKVYFFTSRSAQWRVYVFEKYRYFVNQNDKLNLWLHVNILYIGREEALLKRHCLQAKFKYVIIFLLWKSPMVTCVSFKIR